MTDWKYLLETRKDVLAEVKRAYAKVSMINRTLQDEIQKHLDVFFAISIPFSHSCPTSPIATCVYAAATSWDECLFCGEPYERK